MRCRARRGGSWLRASAAFVGLLACIVAADARAVALAVEAELEMRFSFSPFPAHFVRTGVLNVNGSGPGGALQSLTLPASWIAGQVILAGTSAVPTEEHIVEVANAAGTIAATPSGRLGGSIGLPGFWKSCLFGTCDVAVANLVVPLTVAGAGGQSVRTDVVNLTVVGAPWTTGTVSVGDLTAMGFAHGPLGATSSTARPGGVIQLVTPVRVLTNIGADPVVFAFPTLTLRFVPEPATLLLTGLGVVALAIAGRRRV